MCIRDRYHAGHIALRHHAGDFRFAALGVQKYALAHFPGNIELAGKGGALVVGGHVAPDAVQADFADDAAFCQPWLHLPHVKARRFPGVQAVGERKQRLLLSLIHI